PEAEAVGVLAEHGAKAPNLSEDGRAVPPVSLEPGEAAAEVPGQPEADQLGQVDHRAHLLKARLVGQPVEDLEAFLGQIEPPHLRSPDIGVPASPGSAL